MSTIGGYPYSQRVLDAVAKGLFRSPAPSTGPTSPAIVYAGASFYSELISQILRGPQVTENYALKHIRDEIDELVEELDGYQREEEELEDALIEASTNVATTKRKLDDLKIAERRIIGA